MEDRPIRIGLDLDGVIIDHRPNKMALASDYGVILEPWQTNSNVIHQHLPPESSRDFHEKIYSHLTLTAPPMAGALALIARLPGEIYIISARHKHGSTFADMWLENYGVHDLIPKDRIHFVGGPAEKRPVIERLGIDVFLDDELRVLAALPDGVRKVFFDSDGLKERLSPPPEFHVAGDWEAFFRLI